MLKSSGQIVRRYSSALFELADESKKLAEIREQAKALAGSIDASAVEFFASPRYPNSAKIDVIDTLSKAVKAEEILKKFLTLLVENGRIALIKQILVAFTHRADEKLGIARAEIVSAHKMEEGEINQFRDLLAKALNKKIELTHSVDPSLKAGSVIRLGNTVVDASLRTRLSNLKESLSVGV